MISKIILKGMQSHKNTEFDFTIGSNLILGDNASGKSAMRRGLTWVMTNKPSGTSFINWDLDDNTPCEVTIHYNNHIVTRRRSRNGKINEYIVDGDTLTAFGVKVPQKVQEVFRLDDTNLEQQKAPYFLLSESAPDIARRLNKLTNLETIDLAYSAIRGKKSESSKNIRKLEKDLAIASSEIESYAYLDDAEKIVNQVEPTLAKYADAENQYTNVSNLYTYLKDAKNDLVEPCIISTQECNALLDNMQKTSDEYTDVHKLYSSLKAVDVPIMAPYTPNSIDVLLNDAKRSVSEYSALEELINNIEGVEKLHKVPYTNLTTVLNIYDNALTEYNEVKMLLTNIDNAQEEEASLVLAGIALNKELEDMWPDVCPLCGSKQTK